MENFFIKTFFILIGFGFFSEAVETASQSERISLVSTSEAGKLKSDPGDSPLILAEANIKSVPEERSFFLKAALAEAAHYPQEKDWDLTLEQLADFDFIEKGGTGISYYYLQAWFNMIRQAASLIPDPFQQKSWGEFCYKKDCSTGLNPQKINETAMRSIIRKLSVFSSMNLFASENTGWDGEPVVFLQGFPAPLGSDPWFEIDENQPSPEHIKSMLRQMERMRQKGIKKIAVNLPLQLHNDPWPFVYLGEFIKEEEIDLHIVGGCGHYCATYLVPAAKTVYIEPYGYIYHRGNAMGLLIETMKVFEDQREDLRRRLKKQRLSNLTDEDRCEYVVMSIVSFPDSSMRVIDSFLEPEKKDEFFNKRAEVEHQMSSVSFAHWPEETIRTFVQSLSPKLLEDVTLLFLEGQDSETTGRRSYIVRLKGLSQLEVEYYLATKTGELMSPAGHNYIDFLTASSSFLKDPGYVEHFTVPKPHFNIPEEKKPYEWIVPSTELLRSFGLDVRGENNKEMIDLTEVASLLKVNKKYPAESFLHLSSAKAKTCGLFEDDESFSNGKLKKCFLGK